MSYNSLMAEEETTEAELNYIRGYFDTIYPTQNGAIVNLEGCNYVGYNGSFHQEYTEEDKTFILVDIGGEEKRLYYTRRMNEHLYEAVFAE